MRWRDRLLFATLAGCASILGCKTAPAPRPVPLPELKAADSFEQGIAAFDAGNLGQARELFANALAKEPKLVNAQYNLGLIAEREGDFKRAQASYEAVLEIDPRHRPSIVNLARIYCSNGDYPKAIALHERGLQMVEDAPDPAMINSLATTYRVAKKYSEAEATIQKILGQDANNLDAYKTLILVYYDQGRLRLAELVAANAKRISDRDPGIFNNLGMVYMGMGEPQLAAGEFRKALAIDPKFPLAYSNLGALALSYRDYSGAESYLAEAISLDSASYRNHLYYAYALDGQKAKDIKKAQIAGLEFEKALALRDQDALATCGAGWAYAADPKSASKALRFLQACREQKSTSPQDRRKIEAKIANLTTGNGGDGRSGK
jgi:Flp pilus assembly protein TadD